MTFSFWKYTAQVPVILLGQVDIIGAETEAVSQWKNLPRLNVEWMVDTARKNQEIVKLQLSQKLGFKKIKLGSN